MVYSCWYTQPPFLSGVAGRSRTPREVRCCRLSASLSCWQWGSSAFGCTEVTAEATWLGTVEVPDKQAAIERWPAGTPRRCRRWLAKCGAAQRGLALPRFFTGHPEGPGLFLPACPAACPIASERAVVASVGNGVRVAEFLTRPRPYDTSSPEGRDLRCDPDPACQSSPSPTARLARSRHRHRSRLEGRKLQR